MIDVDTAEVIEVAQKVGGLFDRDDLPLFILSLGMLTLFGFVLWMIIKWIKEDHDRARKELEELKMLYTTRASKKDVAKLEKRVDRLED